MDGRVEVRSGSGDFGLICDLDWTMREANVACRQLGFRLACYKLLIFSKLL